MKRNGDEKSERKKKKKIKKKENEDGEKSRSEGKVFQFSKSVSSSFKKCIIHFTIRGQDLLWFLGGDLKKKKNK